MAAPRTCRNCGTALPGRYPVYTLTWILAILTFVLLLVIPTIVGFASIVGGLAIVLGIFAALLAYYFFVRREDTCEACSVEAQEAKEGKKS